MDSDLLVESFADLFFCCFQNGLHLGISRIRLFFEMYLLGNHLLVPVIQWNGSGEGFGCHRRSRAGLL